MPCEKCKKPREAIGRVVRRFKAGTIMVVRSKPERRKARLEGDK